MPVAKPVHSRRKIPSQRRCHIHPRSRSTVTVHATIIIHVLHQRPSVKTTAAAGADAMTRKARRRHCCRRRYINAASAARRCYDSKHCRGGSRFCATGVRPGDPSRKKAHAGVRCAPAMSRPRRARATACALRAHAAKARYECRQRVSAARACTARSVQHPRRAVRIFSVFCCWFSGYRYGRRKAGGRPNT